MISRPPGDNVFIIGGSKNFLPLVPAILRFIYNRIKSITISTAEIGNVNIIGTGYDIKGMVFLEVAGRPSGAGPGLAIMRARALLLTLKLGTSDGRVNIVDI